MPHCRVMWLEAVTICAVFQECEEPMETASERIISEIRAAVTDADLPNVDITPGGARLILITCPTDAVAQALTANILRKRSDIRSAVRMF